MRSALTSMKGPLSINRDVYDSIVDAAKQALPIEACGILAGKDGCVTENYQLTNADNSPVHCTMIPEEQFAAAKQMREKGLRMEVIWHSHPATPPRMSEEDLRLAYTPDVAYGVLSLASPDGPVFRAFEVEDGEPKEISVTIVDNSSD